MIFDNLDDTCLQVYKLLPFWYSSAVFPEATFYLIWPFSVSLGTVRNAPFYATNSQLLKASFKYVCRHLAPFCPLLSFLFDLTISEFIVFLKDAYVGLLPKFTKTDRTELCDFRQC